MVSQFHMVPVLGIVTVIPYLVYSAIAAAASYVASRFLTPKPNTPFDSKPTTLASRGSVVPVVIGHVRVAPIFAWAGLRDQQTPDSGGKGFGGGGGGGSAYYEEAAWHLLAVGPVDVLYAIYQDGKAIHTTPIYRSETPSGTSFDCPQNQGTFSIYWGECDQPLNTYLANPKQSSNGRSVFPGVLSRWPRTCYLVWHKKNNGSSPYWRQVEYEIARWPNSITSTLTQSSPRIAATTGSDDKYNRNANDGVNPAHALWMLMTAPFPDGAGINPAQWNLSIDDFEAFGVLCQNEQTPINMILRDGQAINEAIADILGDMTVFMNQVGDTIRLNPIRAIADPTTLPMLMPSLNMSPDPEIERVEGYLLADRPQFSFADRAINFTPFTINFGNDAIARQNLRPKLTRVSLPTITDRFTAYFIAERRRLEFIERVVVKLRVAREARLLNPGDAFNHPELGTLRVSTTRISKTAADLECLLDQYTLAASGELYGSAGGLIVSTDGAVADLIVVPFLIPKSRSPNPSLNYFGVARVRANGAVSGAAIWLSPDGTNYSQAGEQDHPSAGGTMNAPVTAAAVMTKSSPLMVGPTFTSLNDDVTGLPDYTGSVQNWKGGSLLCIIDAEVFFIESVSAVDGGYQLNGMIRAQYGTVAADHAAMAPVVVFARSWIVRMNTGTLVDGATVYIKSVPFTFDEVVDITEVVAVPLTVDANATANITLTAPTDAGIVWSAGYREAITWKTLGNQYHTPGGSPFQGGIDIYFSEDGGETFQAVVLNTDNTGSYIWTVPNNLESSSTCYIRVQSHISQNVFDVSTYPFTVAAAPVIALTNPPQADYSTVWYYGHAYHIQWAVTPNTTDTIDISYTIDQSTWVPIVLGTDNDGDFVWVPSQASSGIGTSTNFQVRVSIHGHTDINSTSVQFTLST